MMIIQKYYFKVKLLNCQLFHVYGKEVKGKFQNFFDLQMFSNIYNFRNLRFLSAYYY